MATNKNRLFEVFEKVNKVNLKEWYDNQDQKLNETLLPMEEKIGVIGQFVDFADKKLGLGGDMPNIRLSHDSNEAAEMKSFGKYTPETNELLVVAVNRNLADILRTFAHELVHHKQRKDNKLNQNSNNTGSDEENEANALAGVLLREFGQEHPIIFE